MQTTPGSWTYPFLASRHSPSAKPACLELRVLFSLILYLESHLELYLVTKIKCFTCCLGVPALLQEGWESPAPEQLRASKSRPVAATVLWQAVDSHTWIFPLEECAV